MGCEQRGNASPKVRYLASGEKRDCGPMAGLLIKKELFRIDMSGEFKFSHFIIVFANIHRE